MESVSDNPRKTRTEYWIFFASLLFLAAALILPPLVNMNRYQRRIAEGISNSLGRRVHLSSVTLRLLPRPGLELSDFIVEEDPAFGSEPTLRAPSVDASVRLSSLWRGRLEVGRISFDQPSVNLVRNSEGRWNIGSILLQASHIPNAPTAQRRAGNAPRFPYIEASNARVNFKVGNEKKPFSLLNADFAMWLANPDEWRLRLEAQPARTDLDLDLSDTGLLRVEGSLHRSSTLANMPVDLSAEWSNAPLGQIGRLILGRDTGWRGNLDVTSTLKGNLADAQFKTRIQIAAMHRQEFAPLEPFNIDATCQGGYHNNSRSIEGLTCLWPIDDGHLLLTGAIPNIDHPNPNLNLQIENIPAAFGLSALRLVRNGFAANTEVSGVIGGSLAYSQAPAETLTGDITANALTLRTPGMDSPIKLPPLRIANLSPQPVKRRSRKARPTSPGAPVSLHLADANIPLGEDTPLTVSGEFTRRDFSLHFAGDASLKRLRPVISNLGLLRNAASGLADQGSATLDLTIRGSWLPQTSTDNPVPTVTTEGSLRLKNAIYQASFLPDPLEIVSAQAALTPTQIIWNPVSVIFHKIPATVAATTPVPCPAGACVREFSLSTPQLDAAALQSTLMGAGEHGEFLQEILSRLDRNKIEWPTLDGTVRVATFTLGSLALHDASSALHIEGRQIQFKSIEAHALNGVLQATGTMDATAADPRYVFDIRMVHANAAALTGLWHQPALTGIVNAHTHLELSGYSTDDLTGSAKGTFHWDWTQGATTLVPAALAHFDHWSADGAIGNRQLVLDQSSISKGPITQSVSGTIAFDRKSNLVVSEQEEPARLAKAAQHTQ